MDGGQLERGPARAHAEQHECNQMVALSAELDPGGGERRKRRKSLARPVRGTRIGHRTGLWIRSPARFSMDTGVAGLFGPRPRPRTRRVRERGRGPNRKEGWWWTGCGFERWCRGPERSRVRN